MKKEDTLNCPKHRNYKPNNWELSSNHREGTYNTKNQTSSSRSLKKNL